MELFTIIGMVILLLQLSSCDTKYTELKLDNSCPMNKTILTSNGTVAYHVTFQDLGTDFDVGSISRVYFCSHRACPVITTIDTSDYSRKRVVIQWEYAGSVTEEIVMKVHLNQIDRGSIRWFTVRIVPISPIKYKTYNITFDCLTVDTGTLSTLILLLWRQCDLSTQTTCRHDSNYEYPLETAGNVNAKCTCADQKPHIRPTLVDHTITVNVAEVSTGVVAYNATVYDFSGPHVVSTGIEPVVKDEGLAMDVNATGLYHLLVTVWCMDNLTNPRPDTKCLKVRFLMGSLDRPELSTPRAPEICPGCLPELTITAIATGATGVIAMVAIIGACIFYRRSRQAGQLTSTQSAEITSNNTAPTQATDKVHIPLINVNGRPGPP